MPLAPGKMYRATDIAVDVATNSVYVVEKFNHRISKWNYTDGNFDFVLDPTWGTNGDGTTGNGGPSGDGSPNDTALYHPSGIVFEGTRLTVTDTIHNRIRTITAATGEFIDSVGQAGSGITDFYHPAGIATNGTILVIADEINHRAIKYDVGDTPSSPALLPDPSGGALSLIRPHGVIFEVNTSSFDVADSVRSRISRYDNTATTFTGQIGTPGTTGTDLFFPASGHGQLTGISATVFADTRNSILKHVEGNNIFNTNNTIPGIGDGELYFPESANSFTDAATNYVLAANTLNNRVEAYSNVGANLSPQGNFGSPHA